MCVVSTLQVQIANVDANLGRAQYSTKAIARNVKNKHDCLLVKKYLRWPTSVTAKLTFSRQNILSHGKTYFLTAKHTFSRQNILSHGKTYFFTAKHTFSRQNILSHGKTYFLTANHTFSRQNLLSHGKTFFFTAKHTFSKQFFRFAVKGKHFPMQKRKSVNLVNKEDKVDDSIGNYICNRFTQKYTLRFRISGGVLISTGVGNFLKMK